MRAKTEGTHRGGGDAAVTSTRASNAVLDVEKPQRPVQVADGYFTAVDNVSFRVRAASKSRSWASPARARPTPAWRSLES